MTDELPRIDGNEELSRNARKEEPRFVSIILRDRNCLMDAVSYGIRPEKHFWTSDCRFVYGLAFRYYKQYGSILTRTAMDTILSAQDVSEEEKASKMQLWDDIYNREAPLEDFDLLKTKLNERWIQYQVVKEMKEKIPDLIRATSGQKDIVRKIQEKMLAVDNIDGDAYSRTVGMLEGMDEAWDYIDHRREHPEDVLGVMTGIRAIDNVYNGFLPGSYTVISGMINGGKTTLMFNIAFNMARSGKNVVYVSMEKEAVPLIVRLLSLHALVDYNRIKRGGKGERGLPDHMYERLKEAHQDLNDNIKPNLDFIQVPQGTKLSKIIAEIEKIKMHKKVDVLVVDYLGVIGFETSHPTRPDLDLAEVSLRLQAYGRINKMVTLTALQLKTPSSKEIRNKAKKEASEVEINTEDLSGSQRVIADADNGIGVWLNAEKPATKMFGFITKARDDESRGTIVMDFDGRIGRVSDPELESGQVGDVDHLLYTKKLTPTELEESYELFENKDDISGAPSSDEPPERAKMPEEPKPEPPPSAPQQDHPEEPDDDFLSSASASVATVEKDDLDDLLG